MPIIDDIMRILVTGHRGYVGSVLVRVLNNLHCEPVGLDTDLYEDCDFGRVRETIPSFDQDVRNIQAADLASFDAVIHLAAAPDDAYDSMGRHNADQINVDATLRLAECCREARVPRLLFASTCAVYEGGQDTENNEESELSPLHDAARAKLECERQLKKMAGAAFTPVFLRQGEVYGVSPRMRLDLTTNEIVASAVTERVADSTHNGASRKSLVHLGDLAQAYALLLTAPADKVSGEAFNIVTPNSTMRLVELADLVVEHIPHCARSQSLASTNGRSYCASGEKLLARFPEFRYRWSLQTGIRQLHYAFENAGLTPGDLRSSKYRRALRLRDQIDRGWCDRALQRTRVTAVAS